MAHKKICNYIFELGTLKKFKHGGTMLAGVKDPDSIAEHVYRTTIIGYILAKMEKANPEKVVMICLIHDNAEARITDLNKVAQRYINPKKAEKKAFSDQTSNLPLEIKKTFDSLYKIYDDKKTKEGIIARDADLLETAFQAKEYLDIGYKDCQDWVNNVEKMLKTKSAKTLLKSLKNIKFYEWWKGLKKLQH